MKENIAKPYPVRQLYLEYIKNPLNSKKANNSPTEKWVKNLNR